VLKSHIWCQGLFFLRNSYLKMSQLLSVMASYMGGNQTRNLSNMNTNKSNTDDGEPPQIRIVILTMVNLLKLESTWKAFRPSMSWSRR